MVVKILKSIAKEKLKKKTNIDFSQVEEKIKKFEQGEELVPRTNLEKELPTDKQELTI